MSETIDIGIMSESLKKKTAKGVAWAAVEKFGTQGVQFLTMLVLARLLTPSDYGTVGVLSVFLAISSVFIDCGFTLALIQKKDRTDVDFATVFWCNLVVSCVCYVILFVGAPFVAEFYHMSVLCSLLRVLGITLIVNAFYTVQVTRLTATLDFKTQAVASIVRAVGSGSFGIIMAYGGYGPWAIVWQQVFYAVFSVALFAALTHWWPKFAFSTASVRSFFAFGSKLLITGLMNIIYSQLSSVIIVRTHTSSDLGYFSRGKQLADLPWSLFGTVFTRVIYPVLCTVQDDEERMRAVFAKYLRFMTSLVVPFLFIMSGVADPLVRTLLGERWQDAIVFVQLLAFAYIWDPISMVNMAVLPVKGRTDVGLKMEFVKKPVAIGLMLFFIQFGVIWIAVAMIIYNVFAFILNLCVCGPFIGLGFWQQVREVYRVYLVGLLVLGVTWGISLVLPRHGHGGEWWWQMTRLVVSGGVATLVYFACGYLLHFECLEELKNHLVKICKRKVS